MLKYGLPKCRRKPAWTDRILHMNSSAVQVEQQTYTCHKEITMSDHRPVSATFELHVRHISPSDCMRRMLKVPLQVPVIDAENMESVVHGLWKEASHIENSGDIPRVSVEPAVIDLGKIE